MKHAAIFVSLGLLILASCNKTNLKDMSGTWETVHYYIQETGDTLHQEMTFYFDSIGNYMVDYGELSEEGTYWIDYDKLFTKEEGQREKSVRLSQIKEDTLVLEMNRAGRIEVLILSRRQ